MYIYYEQQTEEEKSAKQDLAPGFSAVYSLQI